MERSCERRFAKANERALSARLRPLDSATCLPAACLPRSRDGRARAEAAVSSPRSVCRTTSRESRSSAGLHVDVLRYARLPARPGRSDPAAAGREYRGLWQLKLPRDEARLELEPPGGPAAPPDELCVLLPAFLRGEQLAPVAKLRTVRRGVRYQENGAARRRRDDRQREADRRTARRAGRSASSRLSSSTANAKALRRIEKALRKAGARDGRPGDPRCFRRWISRRRRPPGTPGRSAPRSSTWPQLRRAVPGDPRCTIPARGLAPTPRTSIRCGSPPGGSARSSAPPGPFSTPSGPRRYGPSSAGSVAPSGRSATSTSSASTSARTRRASTPRHPSGCRDACSRSSRPSGPRPGRDARSARERPLLRAARPARGGRSRAAVVEGTPVAELPREAGVPAAPKGGRRRSSRPERRGAPRDPHQRESARATRRSSPRRRSRKARCGVHREAKALQDVLGAHQDAVFAEAADPGPPRNARGGGDGVRGGTAHRARAGQAAEARAAFPAAWARLEQAGRAAVAVDEPGRSRRGRRRLSSRSERRELEVLLVHRPAYDDWTFPKGKADPGRERPGLRAARGRGGDRASHARSSPRSARRRYVDRPGRHEGRALLLDASSRWCVRAR